MTDCQTTENECLCAVKELSLKVFTAGKAKDLSVVEKCFLYRSPLIGCPCQNPQTGLHQI